MRILTAFVSLFSLICLLVSSNANAAAFMKLGDIKGEAMDDTNSSEIQSVRWMAPESIKQRSSGGGTVTFTKRIDKSSPLLAKSLSSGSTIDEMALAEGKKQFVLKHVQVVAVEKKGHQEVVTMRFAHRQEFGPTQRVAAANHNSTRSNRTVAAANNHNTTRSNKTVAADAEGADYNSSRSNKTHN